MFCCGQDYVNVSDTICCSAASGASKAHVKKKDPTPGKCCETELIPDTQKCCGGAGYNPSKYVCSDKVSAGKTMKVTDRKPLRGTGSTTERETRGSQLCFSNGNRKTPACVIHLRIVSILIPNEFAMMDVIAMSSKGIADD